jgi:hypothetical protein
MQNNITNNKNLCEHGSNSWPKVGDNYETRRP